MNESTTNHLKFEGREIQFPFGYQKRTKDDLFKIFIIENRKSIRGYKRIFPIAIILFLIWLKMQSFLVLVIMIPFMALAIIGIIGYLDIWRVRKKWEEEQIPRRAFVKDRIINYGDYGIVFKEEDKNGILNEKYSWKRYGYVIEWGKSLFLIPAKKRADIFEIRKDEIGAENFLELRNFAKSKLNYKLISNYKEII